MAAPVLVKTPLEVRRYPFAMAALIAQGAALTSVQAFASRAAPPLGVYPLQTTTLAAGVTAGDGTVQLNANPLAGALLILEPGAGQEETLKVISVSGAGAPFTATVIPVAFYGHSNGANASYEPGISAHVLVDDTPTPSGTNVTLEIHRGTHGQQNRISIVATCNDTQIVEDEVTLQITDPTPDETNIKQATETRDLAAEMDNLLSEGHQAGATISSGLAYASATTSTTTTLAAQANAGATSISLTAHPGIGAMLILTPAGTGALPAERVYVSNVSGGGPYTVTVAPALDFTHSNGASVTVFTGVTASFLTAAASSVAGLTVTNRARQGAVGKTFKVVWVATTSQGEQLQHSGLVQVAEI